MKELGVEDRVEFLGFREDVDSELRSLDVLVQHASIALSRRPSGAPGYGRGIASRRRTGGGPSEIVTDGEDGILYPPGNVEALVRHLQLLANDSDLRHRLGAAGRVTAERFTPERIPGSRVASCLP